MKGTIKETVWWVLGWKQHEHEELAIKPASLIVNNENWRSNTSMEQCYLDLSCDILSLPPSLPPLYNLPLSRLGLLYE